MGNQAGAKQNIVSHDPANPFDALLVACHHDTRQIIQAYEDARTATLTSQTAAFLEPDFGGVEPDLTLTRLLCDASYADPRHNIALISKPPAAVVALIEELQERLQPLMSDAWFAPPDSLHMTSLEIAPALTEAECEARVAALLQAVNVQQLCSRTARDASMRTVLARPRLTFDKRAVALTFVPVASSHGELAPNDYTYHHWRRDLWAALQRAGVKVQARYVSASAHISIARFVHLNGAAPAATADNTGADVLHNISIGNEPTEQEWPRRFVNAIAQLNVWLEQHVWPLASSLEGAVGNALLPSGWAAAQSRDAAASRPDDDHEAGVGGGVWRVGQETGLQLRCGRSWYGGGRIVVQGDAY